MIKYSRIYKYEREPIRTFIEEIFDYYNIYEKIMEHGRIIIKPNLLTLSEKQEAVTTNPLIADIIIELLKQKTDKEIIIAEGASASYISMNELFRKTGYSAIAEKHSVKTVNLNTYPHFSRNGIRISSIVREENPYIINLAKLKTHMLTKVTMTVKNVYGMLPAKYKLYYHSQNPDSSNFSRMVSRINNAIKPHFNIVDGITAMEGNGPGNGNPVNAGIIASSDNPFELDHFLIDFMGFDIENIEYMQYGIEREYYSGHYEVEEKPEPLHFEAPQVNKFDKLLKIAKNNLVKHITANYPEIKEDTCRQCMKCYNICPVDSIVIRDGYPRVRTRKCIACYCCIETCPFDSIRSRKSIVESIIDV
ncbi:MAG: DUF362 domain-containing protein [bacterium]